jgi:outer membrane protein TolC
VSSEAGIATREEEVIRARADVGNAEDVLKTLLRLEGEAIWAAPVELETSAAIEAPTVELGKALETAMASRPELARERLAQQSREVDASFQRGQTKPRLDLRVNYGYNGLGGDLLVTDTDGNPVGTIPGDVGDAYDQIFDGDFPGWTVGLEFGYPLQNRTAKARAEIAQIEVDRDQVVMAQLEQRINTRSARRARARHLQAGARIGARLGRRRPRTSTPRRRA